MTRNKLTAMEILEILNKQWATTKDIMLIRGCCYQTATNDRKKIENVIRDKYPKLPRYTVPMEEVVAYYKINIGYLQKVSKVNSK